MATQEENASLWRLVGALTDALQEALENLERMGEGMTRVLDKGESVIDRSKKQETAIRDLHQEHGCDEDRIFCATFTGQCTRVGTCEHCRYKYPCPTLQALEGEIL